MNLYPIFMNLEGRTCLVVGGGKVALRKVTGLIPTGASVRVLAPTLLPELFEMAEKGVIIRGELTHLETELGAAKLCYIATDDGEENLRLAKLCREHGILFNLVDADRPEPGGFTVPSVRQAGSIQLAVNTQGNPSASMAIGDRLLKAIPEEFVDYVQFTGGLRQEMRREIPDGEVRQALMREMHSPETLRGVEENAEKMKARAKELMTRAREKNRIHGRKK